MTGHTPCVLTVDDASSSLDPVSVVIGHTPCVLSSEVLARHSPLDSVSFVTRHTSSIFSDDSTSSSLDPISFVAGHTPYLLSFDSDLLVAGSRQLSNIHARTHTIMMNY